MAGSVMAHSGKLSGADEGSAVPVRPRIAWALAASPAQVPEGILTQTWRAYT